MLLRICLILAILAGAGVIAISHFQVRPHIQSIIDERDKNAKDRDTEKKAKETAQKKLKATETELTTTKNDLTQTQNLLTATKQQAEAAQKQANNLKQDLDKTKLALNESQQKLAQWDLLGIQPSEVTELITSSKNLRLANVGLTEENKILAKRYKDLKAQYDAIVGGNNSDGPPMPGVVGKVLVVDPKWNFVVLDIGEKQGVLQNGVLMVSRNSKLVAKVRIMSVQPDRCIANIMPGWKMGEVVEGDRVIY